MLLYACYSRYYDAAYSDQCSGWCHCHVISDLPRAVFRVTYREQGQTWLDERTTRAEPVEGAVRVRLALVSRCDPF